MPITFSHGVWLFVSTLLWKEIPYDAIISNKILIIGDVRPLAEQGDND